MSLKSHQIYKKKNKKQFFFTNTGLKNPNSMIPTVRRINSVYSKILTANNNYIVCVGRLLKAYVLHINMYVQNCIENKDVE